MKFWNDIKILFFCKKPVKEHIIKILPYSSSSSNFLFLTTFFANLITLLCLDSLQISQQGAWSQLLILLEHRPVLTPTARLTPIRLGLHLKGLLSVRRVQQRQQWLHWVLTESQRDVWKSGRYVCLEHCCPELVAMFVLFILTCFNLTVLWILPQPTASLSKGKLQVLWF